jgi:hypothetical protein
LLELGLRQSVDLWSSRLGCRDNSSPVSEIRQQLSGRRIASSGR